MIKTAMIVDDELLARANLRHLIQQYTDWTIVAELTNGDSLEDYVKQLNPSVVFLDIRMPKRDGIAAATGLLALDNAPLVVFVSAYSDYALKAFELYALDYLLKPFSDERFLQTVTRLNSLGEKYSQVQDVVNKLPREQHAYLKVLIIRSIGVIKIVDVKDVIWCRGSGNYVEVMLAGESHLHRVSLSALEESLDPEVFARCHRSAIVRLSAIKEIKTLDDGQFQLGLENGDTVKLSHTYKDAIMTSLER
jgi:two-component system, LytTR family, response regulator